MQPRSREPGDSPTVTIADYTHLFARLTAGKVDRRSNICQSLVGIELRNKLPRPLHICVLISQFNPAFYTVKQGRRDRKKSVLRITVRHRTNMPIHAEY